MAEHALAMALAAAKRLLPEHHELQAGRFNQFALNRSLLGATCGIVGFGGIGIAVARLFRRLDMRIVAMNRRGQSEEPVDFLGGPEALEQVLREADVLVLAPPLTALTERMIGARELGWMKPDAILINLARGEIIDEDALYAHLLANPGFQACLDAWWIEPVRHGRFAMGHPFLDLPNVLGSPHNSASVPTGREVAMRRVLENVQRVLRGEPPRHLLGPDDRPPA
jgi:phosphoglycerate dehydrogenase-like enzyme